MTLNSTDMMLAAPEQTAMAEAIVDTTDPPVETAAAVTKTPLPAINVNTPADTTTAVDGEDRQEATYFASWGAPEARSGPSKSYPAIAYSCACANLEQRLRFAVFSSRVCLPVLTTPLWHLSFMVAPWILIVSSRRANLRS